MRHPPRLWWRRVSEWFGGPTDDRPAPRRRGRDPWYFTDAHVAETNARARRRPPSNEELVETFNDLLGGGDHR